MGYFPIGESQMQRDSVSVGPLAAVAAGTRAVDYFEIWRAPSDQGARIKRLRFAGNATHAAAATNFVTLQIVAIKGTTVRTLGTTITTDTGGGWISLVEQNLILERHNARLAADERLALRITNTGLGIATNGFSLHWETEIGK